MAPPAKPPPNAKKAKLFNSRTIRAEIVDSTFKNGGLNIPEYISSRQYEITAFEQSQLNTKASSATRVFQSLPRTLRRRTASHNVKRVPKRLRAKALKEMQNTANGTPVKKTHLRGRELHRLKMQKRLLRLASKIKDSRGVPSALGTSVKDKIQSLNKQLAELKKSKAVILNNAVGAFDRCSCNTLMSKPSGNLKYSKRQRQFTWMPTHVWHAKRFHMTKRWGYQIPFSPNQKCFRSTSRAAKEGAIAFDSSFNNELIVECRDLNGISSFLSSFTRYCGSLPNWLITGERVYNGWVYLDDQKLARAAVLVDASESKVLVRLHPSVYETFFNAVVKWSKADFSVLDCRYAIGSIELRGPTALHSLSKILHVDANSEVTANWRAYSQSRDPRLIPSGTKFSFYARDPRFWKHPVRPPPGKEQLNEALIRRQSATDRDAVTALMSSASRTESYKDMYCLKQLGKEFARRDPLSSHIHAASKFPVVIFKTVEESWCILMPWFWVQPVWSKLISVSGVKTGGLRQLHQLNFEYNVPTYPQDFPYLPEGYKEFLMTSRAMEQARSKVPHSKMKPMMDMEGALSSDADWYFLWKWKYGMHFMEKKDSKAVQTFGNFDEQKNRVLRTPDDLALTINATRDIDLGRIPIVAFDKKSSVHESFVNGTFVPEVTKFPALPVVQITLTLSEKGTIKDNARIYERVEKPSLVHLIGYVTSGAFNFNVGKPTGIGLISADRKGFDKVLIRNVGCTTFFRGKLSFT